MMYYLKYLFQTNRTTTVIKYHDWDEDTIARAAAMVAEVEHSQSQPLSLLNVQCQFVKWNTLVVTEEFGEDSDAANSELNRF
jgi:hypothetical protein